MLYKCLCLQCFYTVGRQEWHPACKKTERWGAGMVICLEQGADLHVAQLMPLPVTVSCFSKIQIDFTFLVPAHPGNPEQRAVKHVCVCVLYICLCLCIWFVHFINCCWQLFLLEEMRERKFDGYARIIQKAFRRWNACKQYIRLRNEGNSCYDSSGGTFLDQVTKVAVYNGYWKLYVWAFVCDVCDKNHVHNAALLFLCNHFGHW